MVFSYASWGFLGSASAEKFQVMLWTFWVPPCIAGSGWKPTEMLVFFVLEAVNFLGFKSQVLTRLLQVVVPLLIWFSDPFTVLFQSVLHVPRIATLGLGVWWGENGLNCHLVLTVGVCCSDSDPCTCSSAKHKSSYTAAGITVSSSSLSASSPVLSFNSSFSVLWP